MLRGGPGWQHGGCLHRSRYLSLIRLADGVEQDDNDLAVMNFGDDLATIQEAEETIEDLQPRFARRRFIKADRRTRGGGNAQSRGRLVKSTVVVDEGATA